MAQKKFVYGSVLQPEKRIMNSAARRALLLWTGMNGYESVGAAREVHLSGPIVETGKDEPVVLELQVPVALHAAT